MARPSLFVRPLEQGEMEFLAHLRKSRRQGLRQRAQILMASMVYTPVYQIALICKTDEAHVRRVIHAFNDFGFESLNPKVGTGPPRKFEPGHPRSDRGDRTCAADNLGRAADPLVVAAAEGLLGASASGAPHRGRDAA